MHMPVALRSRFPALTRCHLGRPVAYFDGPGGTQVPTSVVAAMTDYLYHHNANTHWQYGSSIETDQMISDARAAFADLFCAESRSEIVFGLNMTTLTFHIARALGRQWGPRDEVVVTALDHHGNVAPWQALARERGVTVHMARFDPESGALDLEDFARLLNSHTRLVAVGAASNALGTINPVREIVTMAHAVGALAFIDAVHYAAHELTDVQAWDCDFLACSAYKLYGPHVGVLYGRRDILARLDVPKLLAAPNTTPERIETGTQNHEGIAGARAAVDFLASLAPVTAAADSRRAQLVATFGALSRAGEALSRQLWEGLATLPTVHLYGPKPGRPRTPTVSFTVRDLSAHDVARRLADVGVFVSSGDFYATSVLEGLRVSDQGLVRAGCACYSTPTEVDCLVDAIARIPE
jgi:cysteine desulfurase family protein (TIGR01976 family)